MLLLENYGWGANMTTGIAFKNGSNYQGQTAKIYTIMNGGGNQGGEIRFATLAYSGVNPNPNTTLIDRMTIDDLGKVGIGTTSPQAKLHVQNYTTGESHQAMFKGGSVNIGDYSYISLNGGYAADYGKEVRLAAVSESTFGNKTGFAVLTSPDSGGASGHERLRVTADGDVGIGTNDPSEKLDVEGNVKANNYINQRVAWNSGFRHDGNTATSYYFIPVGYISEITGDTYYNNWIAPYAGRVRKIVLRNTGQATVPTATTVNFRVSVNGSVVHEGSTITVTGSGLNILASETLSDTDAVFSATDRVQVAYRTDGLWRNTAAGISLEYTE
jgi:hypothetical protein